mgnify:CR=1 FL=1|jgi:hypothetical protein
MLPERIQELRDTVLDHLNEGQQTKLGNEIIHGE